MQILPLLLGFLNLLDSAYKALIGVLWSALVTFGLSPRYTFLVPFTSYGPFLNLENSLLSGFYFQFSVLVVLAGTIVMLGYNSFQRPQPGHLFVSRLLASVLFGAISFFMVVFFLSALNGIYGYIYSASGLNWSDFLLFASTLPSTGNHALVGGSDSALIEIFTLSGYFTSIISLFAMLMLRQALMLFSLIVLPFATVLLSFKGGSRFARVVWEIIIEMSAYPFFVLACLYLGHIFSWDMPLQLAFLFLPSLLPGILFASGRGFLSAPIMGFLGEMSLSGSVGKGLETADILAGFAKGGSFSGAIRETALLPVSDSHSANHSGNHAKGREVMPWKELLNEELKYRRE